MEKEFGDLIEGDIDPNCGGVIKTLIMKGDGFIVYLGEQHGICWATNGYEEFASDFGQISNRVKTLEGLTGNLFRGEELRSFNYLLAQGFARVFDDRNILNANQILDEVEKSIGEHGKQSLKIQYIVASFITTILVGVTLIIAWIFRSYLIEFLQRNAFEILMASLCGGIGAFISSFIRTIKFQVDIRVPRNTYRLDGFLRIFYGLVAGFVICLAIKSNLLFGIINEIEEKSLTVICFLSTIAGASESLIPSIIKKVEGKI